MYRGSFATVLFHAGVRLTSWFETRDADDLSLVGSYKDAPQGEWYASEERPNCKVRVGDLATGLDVDKKTVACGDELVSYDKCVLATGSYPFVPPIPGKDLPGVFVYRTIDDLEALVAYQKAHGARAAFDFLSRRRRRGERRRRARRVDGAALSRRRRRGESRPRRGTRGQLRRVDAAGARAGTREDLNHTKTQVRRDAEVHDAGDVARDRRRRHGRDQAPGRLDREVDLLLGRAPPLPLPPPEVYITHPL